MWPGIILQPRLNQRFYEYEASGCAAANFSGVICAGEIHWQLHYGPSFQDLSRMLTL